ncbi:uncharacterized protein LOC115624694 [Scaptodrosophila lebanonensis]|uniref:Uncharacterized protein LOC115624694 n=1 Tax=Drosophila lebanonensis TaxID=7225 RepID=A0A6J2TK28_DROLE|nr:uncharacterized protein LOC115624694 [Scaptodrosophila lebanonensis]
MEIIYVKKCCFCINLKIACIIIAIFDCILTSLAHKFDAHADAVPHVATIIFLCHFISCILLLLGGILERPVLLLLYMRLTVLRVFWSLVFCFLAVCVGKIALVAIAIETLMITTGVYFWIVVNSYYGLLGGHQYII